MRIKYADEPQRFMDSEVELNNAIQVGLNKFFRYLFIFVLKN